MSAKSSALAKREQGAAEPSVQALAIPASAHKLDRRLVDRSVVQIREIVGTTLARGLDEVGAFLLKAFFDDDPEVFFASGPNKHTSLLKLIERCDSIELPVSRTFLINALRVAVTSRALPRASTFNQLPPSHRVELLRVRKHETLERLATRAVEGKLSVQKLRTLVQKTEVRSKDAPGRGRVAAPDVIKAIEGCLRLLRDEESGKLLFRRGDVTDLTEEQWERASAAFKVLDKRVADLRRILG
jgi:hypothetical protein